jgi:hypothetical protein
MREWPLDAYQLKIAIPRVIVTHRGRVTAKG